MNVVAAGSRLAQPWPLFWTPDPHAVFHAARQSSGAIRGSHRDIEDILAQRGNLVTHESVRVWCTKFGPQYAQRLRHGHRGDGDSLFMDEVFVRIQGQQRYLWRAVDQDGEVVDVLLQERRDATSARRFFRHLLTRLGNEPRTVVTAKLRSYAVAHRDLAPDAAHDTRRYADTRAELSRHPTRVRERGMRGFKSMPQAPRFVRVHAAVSNLFNLGRHLVAAGHYRMLRQRAFASWDRAAAISRQSGRETAAAES